jgi:hypothetical protein
MPRKEDFIVKRGNRLRLTLPKGSIVIAGEGGAPGPDEDSKALQPSDVDDETFAFRKTATVEFYQINFAEGLFDAPSSDVIGGLYSASFKAWYLSLGNTEEDFAASHPNWQLMTADDLTSGGSGPHGTEAGGASLTLAKTKAIDAALVAGFDADASTPLVARPGEFVGDTFGFESSPGVFTQGLNSTRLYNGRAPYGSPLTYQRSAQKENLKGTNKMRFTKPLRAIEVGDGETWSRFKTGFDPDFPFAPGQSGFKVTKEPSFEAERVDLNYTGGKIKVYLKPLPRIFSVEAVASYFFPYPFWRDEGPAFQDGATKRIFWGGQIDLFAPFENWFKNYATLARSYTNHWSARIGASGDAATGIAAFKAESATKAEERFEWLLEHNGFGDAGEGYTWFPAVYSSMVPNTELEALTLEAAGDLPRYYNTIDRGYFLHNGTGGFISSRWQYEGEFLGAVKYSGETYYVWRYTQGHKNLFTSPTHSQVFNVSNVAWELEPRFIYTSETGGSFNPTESDHHKIVDTTRPDFVHIHYSQGGLGDVDSDLPFYYQPKYVVDFGVKPRRFQT